MRLSHAFLVAAVVLLPVTSHAVTTSPGKSSVFAYEAVSLDLTGDITPVLGQILKGKKNTVVKVDVTLDVSASAGAVPGLYLDIFVNDVLAGGSTGQCDGASPYICSTSATFWLDVDAAELAHPGVFVGQPLALKLIGGNIQSVGEGLPYWVTVSTIVVLASSCRRSGRFSSCVSMRFGWSGISSDQDQRSRARSVRRARRCGISSQMSACSKLGRARSRE